MSIRHHTTIRSNGKKTRRTTVSHKFLGQRYTTTYVETDEDIKRKARAEDKLARFLGLVVLLLTAQFIIYCGNGSNSALTAVWGVFIDFCIILRFISKSRLKIDSKYYIAAILLFIGVAIIAVAAHDYGLSIAAVCVGLVFIAPSIIMGVLAYKQIKADKDSGLYYAIKDLKVLLKAANIKNQTDYINAVSDLYSKPEYTAQYTSKLKMLYLIIPLEYKQQFEDYINTHFPDYAVVIL